MMKTMADDGTLVLEEAPPASCHRLTGSPRRRRARWSAPEGRRPGWQPLGGRLPLADVPRPRVEDAVHDVHEEVRDDDDQRRENGDPITTEKSRLKTELMKCDAGSRR